MPLFEIETANHIIIIWAKDEAARPHVVRRAILMSRRFG